jgi:hypothetical protein
VYIAQVSFYAPDAGPMNVIARDEAHARELIPNLLPNFKDVKILDIVEQSLIQRPRIADPDEGNAPSSEMVN